MIKAYLGTMSMLITAVFIFQLILSALTIFPFMFVLIYSDFSLSLQAAAIDYISPVDAQATAARLKSNKLYRTFESSIAIVGPQSRDYKGARQDRQSAFPVGIRASYPLFTGMEQWGIHPVEIPVYFEINTVGSYKYRD